LRTLLETNCLKLFAEASCSSIWEDLDKEGKNKENLVPVMNRTYERNLLYIYDDDNDDNDDNT
jgi:hypothetical protein